MAAQAGIDLVVKIGDGSTPTEAFATVGGARSNSLSFNNTPIDATSASSTGHWREYLDGKPNPSMDISVSGVFQDDAQDAQIQTDMYASTLRNFQIVVPDFGTFEGPFLITSYSVNGSHDGEMTFDLSLQSGGQVSYTAA